MALKKEGDQWYGETQADIQTELIRYSTLNGYLAQHFANAICTCGRRTFGMLLDETEGAAVRVCTACEDEHPIGDSEDYLEDAEFEECQCLCGEAAFEITVGVALYPDSEDVRWVYIGCRCSECGLTGCYGDWKNEFEDYREYLEQV